MTRDQIVSEARLWLGTRWRHQGRAPDALDCIGLVLAVADAFDVRYKDESGYAREPANDRFIAALRRWFPPAPPGNLIGTIGCFRQAHFPCHVGIFSTKWGVTHLINARADAHKVIEEPWVPGTGFFLSQTLAFPGLEG
jgi:cell wall-associated NlpC family hydrolase